ncbi:MAG: hypothetical protein ACE14L_12940 [Terriglobales bacterium]
MPNILVPKPRGTKLSRVLARWASRSCTYEEVRVGQSIQAVNNSQAGFRFQGFNGNPLRGRIVLALCEIAACSVFVETGSGKGATTLCAHSFLRLPVWSCELNRINYHLCRLLTWGLKNVRVIHASSPEFLRDCVGHIEHGNDIPFFFLDAHGGFDGTGMTGSSCPLLEELRIVFQLPEFVVMIDDVAVDGFLAGSYGATIIDMDLLRPMLREHDIQSCWLPNYPAAVEIGWPSGYCIFWRSAKLDQKFESPQFPLNLLRKVQLSLQPASSIGEGGSGAHRS